MMNEYIANFPTQLTEALHLANKFSFNPHNDIQNIVISGMGGSGIGGTFAQEYAFSFSSIPIFINKSYHLPNFINEHSLVIASSYSGNTEETLNCFHDAVEKHAQMIGITSGGKLEKYCQQHHYPFIIIPDGFPPRTALGYSLVQILNIFSLLNLIPSEWKKEIQVSADLLTKEQNNIRTLAREIAKQLFNTFPIIYSLHSEAIAIRLRQQLNENSKILCSHHMIPEMNHNELVGWRLLHSKHTVLCFLTDFDLDQNRRRYAFCKQIFIQHQIPVIELKAKGGNILPQWMYLIHLSDWISYELALLNHADPVEVKVIDQLKQTLNN